MFWSKIWFFLVALAGAVALTIALVLPRPAQRTLVRAEANRLSTACGVIHILLADDARNRVELAGAFARAPEIMNALESASSAERLDEARMKQVRDIGDTVMKAIQGNRKPDFAMLIDRRGRVVARVRLDDGDFGDIAAGRPLIDDALAGYLRDDLWAHNGTMYFVSAAPVVKQGSYAGAVVLGHQVTNQLAETLVKSLDVDMGFHLGADGIAGSKTIAFDHTAMQAALAQLDDDLASDCQVVRPIDVHAGTESYTALVARLPGEAAAKQAFYSVIIQRPDGLGFLGTLGAVKDNDLSFGNFPWILVGGGFLAVLVLGIGLLYVEADRPLRRIADDAVRLAKGDTERMSEDAHGGKLGSIARSVNIHIDKLGREAKAARKDLDQLLGPAPEGSLGTGKGPGLGAGLGTGLGTKLGTGPGTKLGAGLGTGAGTGLGTAPGTGPGTIDLLATALPTVRPGGPAPAVPPPPSEFRFQDSGPVPVRKTPPPRPATQPAVPAVSPPARATPPRPVAPVSPAPSAPRMLALDDDILGAPSAALAPPLDVYFKQVFEQFVTLKQHCGESIAGLVFERFAEKLGKNREDLIQKTGCRDVRFTVYVKDGKAALKATPVKDEA